MKSKILSAIVVMSSFILLSVFFGAWTIIILTALNLIAHFFLMRFFAWFNSDRPDPISFLENTWFHQTLLIPPLALFVSVFLILLGIVLNLFKPKKK